MYRARATKLGRAVAIKVLPEAFAPDAERLARFHREALVLTPLNHPNIATIHGVEQGDGAHALVLELVEGPTLAERIARSGALGAGFSRLDVFRGAGLPAGASRLRTPGSRPRFVCLTPSRRLRADSRDVHQAHTRQS